MMKWKPSPESLKERFASAISSVKGAEKRQMFGYPCAFVNGNMFTGLHQDSMIIRLPEVERKAFVSRYKSKVFEPMPGREMKEYVVVPEKMIGDAKELGRWLAISFEYAKSLPPKKSK